MDPLDWSDKENLKMD